MCATRVGEEETDWERQSVAKAESKKNGHGGKMVQVQRKNEALPPAVGYALRADDAEPFGSTLAPIYALLLFD